MLVGLKTYEIQRWLEGINLIEIAKLGFDFRRSESGQWSTINRCCPVTGEGGIGAPSPPREAR